MSWTRQGAILQKRLPRTSVTDGEGRGDEPREELFLSKGTVL